MIIFMHGRELGSEYPNGYPKQLLRKLKVRGMGDKY